MDSRTLIVCAAVAGLAACSDVTTITKASPSGTSADGGPEGPAVCGDGQVQASEACDDGNTDDGDGCSRDCTKLAPASLHLDKFVFASLRTAANGFKEPLDIDLTNTKCDKLPFATEALRASIVKQAESSFSLRIAATKAGAQPILNSFLVFGLEVPRKLGKFTVTPPKDLAWFSSSNAPELNYTVKCQVADAEVLSESADRRIYHVRAAGSCDWVRTDSGSLTSTTKETISTELTVVLLP